MKRALLIAGGGTLGTHTANELLRLGCEVDVICPEAKISHHPNLHFIQSLATNELLTDLFAKQHYDGIVNFIHYKTLDEYKKVHDLLINNTDHLIFLSSYRVYADLEHPITEESPRLYDVSDDEDLLANEPYAIPKTKCEDFLRNECKGQPWTIVRPVISFSQYRLDLHMHGGKSVMEAVQNGKPLYIPASAKHLGAGLDWAGNSGKLIASLLFKPHTYGEAYTVSSAQNLTWEQVAQIYTDLTGVQVVWCSEEDFLEHYPECKSGRTGWRWVYDRKFDRVVDNSKILAATGLTSADFVSIRDGLAMEWNNLRQAEEQEKNA